MNATSARRSIAVIGAGWAGCAAAVELARRGCAVHVYEAARIAGGRARRIDLHGHAVDNGQHILLGAYRDTLHLMHQVGLEPASLLLRLPLRSQAVTQHVQEHPRRGALGRRVERGNAQRTP